jgi:hypothetical protein
MKHRSGVNYRRDPVGGLFRWHDGIDLKIGNIAPTPSIEQSAILGFHNLEATLELFVDPAQNVLQTFWSQAPMITKSSIDRERIGIPKLFNDHE